MVSVNDNYYQVVVDNLNCVVLCIKASIKVLSCTEFLCSATIRNLNTRVKPLFVVYWFYIHNI